MCTSLTLTNQAQQHFFSKNHGFWLSARRKTSRDSQKLCMEKSNLMARNKQNTAFLGRGEI